MGGGELARDFLTADLVDELYLGVVPVLLGEGIRFFPTVFGSAISPWSRTRPIQKGRSP